MGLPDRGEKVDVSGGARAARSCPIERGRRLLRWELPLRGAGPDRERKEAALGGALAARGFSIERGRRLLWGELPLRRAAR